MTAGAGRLLRSSCRGPALLAAVLLAGCPRGPDSYCETFAHQGAPVVLSVPAAYYAAPRRADGAVALRFRYRDFAAVGGAGFDWSELEDPAWSLERSDYPALLQIDRRAVKWPERIEDFGLRSSKLREVASDWEGWIKLALCPETCAERIYLSRKWRKAGLFYVECGEAEGGDPKRLECTAHDFFQGLQVTFQFPAAQKAHFEEFRDRIAALIGKMAEDGKTACLAKE